GREAARDQLPGAAAAGRPGDAARLQRQHPHAGAAMHPTRRARRVHRTARRSTGQAVRAKAIERLAPWGGTALYDVVIRALDLLGRQSGRRALLVFSDGEDQSSHATMPSVVQRAEASDATIYIIGQGRALRAATLQQLMKQL